MVALCKAPTKSAGIGLSITAVCKNAGKKTLGQDDFFVVGGGGVGGQRVGMLLLV